MRRAHRNPGVAYGKALDALDAAERKMRRAFRAWETARRALRNAEARLNRGEMAEAEERLK